MECDGGVQRSVLAERRWLTVQARSAVACTAQCVDWAQVAHDSARAARRRSVPARWRRWRTDSENRRPPLSWRTAWSVLGHLQQSGGRALHAVREVRAVCAVRVVRAGVREAGHEDVVLRGHLLLPRLGPKAQRGRPPCSSSDRRADRLRDEMQRGIENGRDPSEASGRGGRGGSLPIHSFVTSRRTSVAHARAHHQHQLASHHAEARWHAQHPPREAVEVDCTEHRGQQAGRRRAAARLPRRGPEHALDGAHPGVRRGAHAHIRGVRAFPGVTRRHHPTRAARRARR